jgi:hypothetical protein
VQGDIEAITAIKDANWKERNWVNHLSFVAEGSPAAAWIAMVILLPCPGCQAFTVGHRKNLGHT